MIRHLGTGIISFIIFTSVLVAVIPARSNDLQHSEINEMSNGTIEAGQLTICTLKSGKNLKDVEELMPSIMDLHKEFNLSSFFGIMTPLFVSR